MAERISLAIVGAGPAGLSAARVALEAGTDAVLLDEQLAAGGQIYRGIGSASAERCRVLGRDYTGGATLLKVLGQRGLDYRPGTTVWEITGDGMILFSREERTGVVAADQIILCPGALERPMPFPGWTLPGVMTCGAGQILLKSAGAFPAEGAVLAGSGPLLLLLATQLLDAGARLTAVVETTATANYPQALRYLPAALRTPGYLLKGLNMFRRLSAAGVPWFRSANHLRAEGRDRVEALHFRVAGKPEVIECAMLLIHQGVVPNVQLSRSMGLDHEWYALQRSWRPKLDPWGLSSSARIAISGDGAGIMGASASKAHGQLVALGALERLGVLDRAERDRRAGPPLGRFRRELAPRPFLDRLYAPHREFLSPPDDAIVCRCEEVTARQIRGYVDLGCLGPNQAKAFGRSGMGPCQGRLCGLTVSEIIADARDVEPDAVGYYRIRPPIKPVTLGELAAMESLEEAGAGPDPN